MASENGWRERIQCDENVVVGEPVVAGTRVTVSVVVGSLADGMSEEELLEAYPQLELEDIRACLHYASESAKNDIQHGIPT